MLRKIQRKLDIGNKRKPKPFSKSRWNVLNFLAKFDLFGEPIPAFNVRGKDKVKTPPGGILSTIIITISLGFAIIKWFELMARSDPIINNNIVANHYDTASAGYSL